MKNMVDPGRPVLPHRSGDGLGGLANSEPAMTEINAKSIDDLKKILKRHDDREYDLYVVPKDHPFTDDQIKRAAPGIGRPVKIERV